MSDQTDKKTWTMLSAEEKRQTIGAIRGAGHSFAANKDPDLARFGELIDAAADELEKPTWGQGGDTW